MLYTDSTVLVTRVVDDGFVYSRCLVHIVAGPSLSRALVQPEKLFVCNIEIGIIYGSLDFRDHGI